MTKRTNFHQCNHSTLRVFDLFDVSYKGITCQSTSQEKHIDEYEKQDTIL